ncbi:uncharacterized protein PGTG_21530 [Puccinia graminis f. sp. tritici CRL 75-36-700-3]|uniref:Uncharacterized protein n=1 Tax=Puccinia graminis f. sp. tritici (strain CRL 75-36-700-3 / race SCCL) TaxID=418459 RepID=H6QRQ6_PUCGT|nr:uncharacterized protein PGTG_21530 [Puccinia graminis f. sp. tritici CRL 75-36-700-3]EHS63353.1 hypothetical protein PGTG_21530 [Puccinia graminis f. sp. tritici CRL 75-36-700-3]
MGSLTATLQGPSGWPDFATETRGVCSNVPSPTTTEGSAAGSTNQLSTAVPFPSSVSAVPKPISMEIIIKAWGHMASGEGRHSCADVDVLVQFRTQ